MHPHEQDSLDLFYNQGKMTFTIVKYVQNSTRILVKTITIVHRQHNGKTPPNLVWPIPPTQLFSVLRPGIKFPNLKLTTETDGWLVSHFDCCITVRHILMIQTSEWLQRRLAGLVARSWLGQLAVLRLLRSHLFVIRVNDNGQVPEEREDGQHNR